MGQKIKRKEIVEKVDELLSHLEAVVRDQDGKGYIYKGGYAFKISKQIRAMLTGDEFAFTNN